MLYIDLRLEQILVMPLVMEGVWTLDIPRPAHL